MKTALVVVLLLASVATGTAAADTVNYVNNPLYTTSGITNLSATGGTMAGMSVTAYFSDQSSQTLTWAAADAFLGGVTGTNWSLSVNGDTFTASWVLNVTTPAAAFVGITRLLINGVPGNTAFDTWVSPDGTANSGPGQPFDFRVGGSETAATYAGPLALDDAAPMGDLYTSLDLVFASPFDGQMTFRADTDNTSGPITPEQPTPAPEPTSLLLAGLGLLGLAGTMRKNRK